MKLKQKKSTYHFILSGGGTGGHIYPAIAIANALKVKYPDASILFVGAKDKMEMEKVPQAGYPIKGLWISGLQRSLKWSNLLFPIKLVSSLLAAKKIIKQNQPDLVIGTGGYASAPLLRVASGKKIPTLIQEQNSYAGITNKWLSGRVNKICVAYENMQQFFPLQKMVLTGNPVREDLVSINITKEESAHFFGLKPNLKTVLILGGSLGARAINELVEKNLQFFKQNNVQLIWQCGSFYANQFQKYNSDTIKVLPFIKEMPFAYAAASYIVSRAGALSVSELCLVGKPVIFIPSPNVAEDHQTKNALAIVNKNAAILIKENELEDQFQIKFNALLQNNALQEELAKNIKGLAKPNATQEIVAEIEKLLKLKKI